MNHRLPLCPRSPIARLLAVAAACMHDIHNDLQAMNIGP